MIHHPNIRVKRMIIEWVLRKYLRYSNYSDLPSSGLVEFYKSEKTAPEEFSFFRKIFTPDCLKRKNVLIRYICQILFIQLLILC